MKKVLAITLTMAMLFTMTAMAETTVKEMGDSSNPVTATYSGNNGGGTIYSIDITWGSLEYTYNAANKGAWDPETHTYKDTSEASWSCDEGADTITVTNHSNAGVSVSMKYEQSESYTNITGTLDNPSFELATAENTGVDEAPSNKSTLELSGDLAENTSNVQVGTVTVTIGGTDSSNGADISDETNDDIPKINNITLANEWNYNNVYLTVEGLHLDKITKDTFDKHIKIIATIDSEPVEMLFIKNNKLSGDVDYIYNQDGTATVKYEQAYFFNVLQSSISNIQKLEYEDLNSTEGVKNIYTPA
ncbi:MAG: hypothetical protein IJN37_07830 [Clostridia bacterium]|nr:hypothetical protein [Clostridia bacterium]